MERPRLFLDTRETDSTEYVELLDAKISEDVKGLSSFSLAIDPDPNALYEMHITRLIDVVDLELTAIWQVTLAHLTSGVYMGFLAADHIVVRHKTTDAAITVKTGITCAFNEVVPPRGKRF